MASLPIRYRPAAVSELDDALAWYASKAGERVADEFRQAVRAKLEEAAQSPHHWPLRRDGTRLIQVHPYSYYLVVREISGTLELVAIAHTSRRPGYWKGRLSDS